MAISLRWIWRSCHAPRITLPAAPDPIADRDEYSISIHIDTAARSRLRKLLDQHLADTLDLLSQTKQAHWNATGMYFYQFHKLFDRVAKDSGRPRERRRQTHHRARRRSQGNGANSRRPIRAYRNCRWTWAMANARSHCSKRAMPNWPKQRAKPSTKRLDWRDADTANLFTALHAISDQARWFLEAHLRA